MDWRAYHIFYHADLSHLIRELARPLVEELVACGVIDGFFIVRYAMGGPHLRLRLRLRDGRNQGEAEEMLSYQAQKFFRRHPSSKTLQPDHILKANQGIATGDSFAQNEVNVVYPDNSWKPFPPMIEVDRYGGPDYVESSLNLFHLSSSTAFDLLHKHREPTRAWATAEMMRLTLGLAYSFAFTEEEFLRLVSYGLEPWGKLYPACAAQADRMFTVKQETITEFVLTELEMASRMNPGESALLDGAVQLAATIRPLPPTMRWRITSSHIHMSANRLGLLNPEEAYLSQVLALAVHRVRACFPAAWKLIWALHGKRNERRDVLFAIQ